MGSPGGSLGAATLGWELERDAFRKPPHCRRTLLATKGASHPASEFKAGSAFSRMISAKRFLFLSLSFPTYKMGIMKLPTCRFVVKSNETMDMKAESLRFWLEVRASRRGGPHQPPPCHSASRFAYPSLSLLV